MIVIDFGLNVLLNYVDLTDKNVLIVLNVFCKIKNFTLRDFTAVPELLNCGGLGFQLVGRTLKLFD